MKQTPPTDIVTTVLKEIDCYPAPDAVLSKMTLDFEIATDELARKTITKESFAQAVRDIFAPKKKAKEPQNNHITQVKA